MSHLSLVAKAQLAHRLPALFAVAAISCTPKRDPLKPGHAKKVTTDRRTVRAIGYAGGAAGGGIETELGFCHRVTAGVKGFWSNIETDNHKKCSGESNICTVFNPATGQAFIGSALSIKTDRDVVYWGGQAELKFEPVNPIYKKPYFYRNDYFIIGWRRARNRSR
jgi:hypothetical protein